MLVGTATTSPGRGSQILGLFNLLMSGKFQEKHAMFFWGPERTRNGLTRIRLVPV